jgi:hypothetical protein
MRVWFGGTNLTTEHVITLGGGLQLPSAVLGALSAGGTTDGLNLRSITVEIWRVR